MTHQVIPEEEHVQSQPMAIEMDVMLREYDKLKDEQIHRIGFRDNMIYVVLVAIGGVLSFSMAQPGNKFALLIVPWISIILGWTYLVNDEKISAIGSYIRRDLAPRLNQFLGKDCEELFGWELMHRVDKRRLSRKIIQLIIDQFAFVGSGAAAVVIYLLVETPSTWTLLIAVIEFILLTILSVELIIYAEVRGGR